MNDGSVDDCVEWGRMVVVFESLRWCRGGAMVVVAPTLG